VESHEKGRFMSFDEKALMRSRRNTEGRSIAPAFGVFK
jgi:hypothetical protein